MCKNVFFFLLQFLLILNFVDQNASYASDSATTGRDFVEYPDQNVIWSKFLNMDQIVDWLRTVAFLYKNELFDINRVTVGRTYQNRSIYGITITSKDRTKNRPGVILESGMEGPHDVLVISATTWMVNQILQNNDEDSIWHQFNYLYIPVVNVDGYQYSINMAGHISHYSRKSRRPLDYEWMRSVCYGVHLNRNWETQSYSSGDYSPCSEFYQGSEPFSEPETQSLSNYYRRNRQNYDIFISLQNKGQLILFPGYKNERELPLKHDYWQKIASDASAAAWRVSRSEQLFSDPDEFETGVLDKYGVGTGSSASWYNENFNSTLIFVVKLRTKIYNLLSENYIIPSGKELMVIVETMLKSYEKIPHN